eukprot:4478528-Lingulodinium_polyedra.AAC.1
MEVSRRASSDLVSLSILHGYPPSSSVTRVAATDSSLLGALGLRLAPAVRCVVGFRTPDDGECADGDGDFMDVGERGTFIGTVGVSTNSVCAQSSLPFSKSDGPNGSS